MLVVGALISIVGLAIIYWALKQLRPDSTTSGTSSPTSSPVSTPLPSSSGGNPII